MARESLSSESKRLLLTIARESLQLRARTGRPPDQSALGLAEIPDEIQGQRGAFVSLHTRPDGELRGCMGHVGPQEPLWQSVVDNAVHAGWDDPRFRPLTETEIQELEIEVTVLSPMEPIRSPIEIEIGLHGLMIESGAHRGVLLPQVASERHWDARTFLDQVCRKAHLAPGAWGAPSATVWRFEADHFGESEMGVDSH